MNPQQEIENLKKEGKELGAKNGGYGCCTEWGEGEDKKLFDLIDRAFSLGRYEGAKGCAESIDLGKGGFDSDHKNPYDDFGPNSQSTAYTNGACDMMFQLRKQTKEYAESLNPEKK